MRGSRSQTLAIATIAVFVFAGIGVLAPGTTDTARAAPAHHKQVAAVAPSTTSLTLSRVWIEGGGTTELLNSNGWRAITATWVDPSFPTGGWVVVWPGIESNSICPSVGCMVQAGTGTDTNPTPAPRPTQFWVDYYPQPNFIAPLPAPRPGDLVSVTLSRLAPRRWRVTLADQTQHTSWSQTKVWSTWGGKGALFAIEALPGYPPLCTPVDWKVATATTRSGRVVNALPVIAATQARIASETVAGCPPPHPTTPPPATLPPATLPPATLPPTPTYVPPAPASIGNTTAGAMAPTPDGAGYWIATTNGGVFAFGDARFYGSMEGVTLAAPITHITATPDGKGYWLVTADGGVFAFGSATFDGSMAGIRLNAPVVGMASTPRGHGYWLVASNGDVFPFGTATFDGSMAGAHLNAPVTGIAAAPGGHGYWLVARDGGVFAFGSAHFYGSTGGSDTNAVVVAMAATTNGHGYWLVTAGGGISTFGSAVFRGSMGGQPLGAPVVGITADPTTGGYWEVGSDGGIFAFGAPFFGSGAS